MNPLLVAGLVFVLIFGLVSALTEARVSGSRRLAERLGRLAGLSASVPPTPPANTGGLRPDVLPTVTHWLRQRDLEPRLRSLMLQADLRLRPAEWIALCVAAAIAGFLSGLLLTHLLLPALLLGALGAGVPPLVLQVRRDTRRRRFDLQLPDALMLLSSALRAGYSFPQAAQTVADELPPPLASEFTWASGEIRLGVPVDVALGRILTRVPSPDLELVITAILIQLPLGGNLAEVLDTIAETIQERVRVAGEVQTLTAEGRLSAGILIVLAPALAAVLFLRSPEYFQPLLQSPLGHTLMIGAVAGQIVGGLLVRRMVALDM